MNGTNRFRRTRVEQSRVSRLHGRAGPKGSLIRKPYLDFSLELRTALFFVGIFIAVGVAYLGLGRSGAVSSGSDLGLILPFTLGFLAVCAVSSALAFLVTLRHKLLLVSLVSGAVTAAAILAQLGTLEAAAKLVFATSTGLWIGLMLTSISQVAIIAGLIIVVDFYSVFLGPTKKIVESGGNLIDYFTINLPVFGAPAVSRVGVSDLIFFSLFMACTLTYRLRRTATALAMTASFAGTMIVGVSLDMGVPALPLLSISFLLANADLLYRRFLEEPDEHKRDRG